MRFLVVSALCLMVAPVAAQDMPGPFNRCLACHAVGEDAVNKVGPRLNGVVDRPAGLVQDYSYSVTLRAARDAGLVWNRESLTRYLKNTRAFMPGTSMSFAGMRVRAEIDAIIDYLATFDVDGSRVAP